MTRSTTPARIGFLWPVDGVTDDEYLKFVPDGVSWLTARYDAGTLTEDLTPEVLSAYADPAVLRRGAGLLQAARPDAVACGDHAASFIRGQPGEQAMTRAMEETLGCPAVTMGQAILQALGAIGATRIALASPYSDTVTDALHRYFTQAGIEIVACHVLGAERETEVATHGPEAWLADLGAFGSRCTVRPDAVVLAGGGVRMASKITQFEAMTGLTMVTGPGALVRAALQRLGLPHARPGLGRLFRGQATRAAATIAKRQSTGTKSFAVSDTPPAFVAGSGSWLVAEDGKSYLDFASGSGTTALGHGHPDVLSALALQAASGVLHLGPHFHAPGQASLYDTLAGMLPGHLTRFHPSVSGAEATEVAIKAAMHATGARRFIGFEGGYHGRTFGALAVSGARGKNGILGPFAPATEILPFPSDRLKGDAVADRIRSGGATLAGVIIEPIQATAGLRIADRAGLEAIARAAADTGVPLIVDEVFTGFGRTGRMFAFDHFGLEPDMVILGKSLGGGLPTGLVAGREALLAHWPSGTQTSTFQMHPASAATAEAFLRVLSRDGLGQRAAQIAPVLQTALAPLQRFADIRHLRGVGAFWALALRSAEVTARVRQRALERGLLTWECGLAGDVIGLVPPLTVTAEEVRRAASMLEAALTAEQGGSAA